MAEPFLAEIRMVGFTFAPRGWALCDGQILPINQNQSLFSLLGTTYGGDGEMNFALPDLRGRVPIHVGSSNGTSHQLGRKLGEESHTLSIQGMPAHTHTMNASADAAQTISPQGTLLAQAETEVYETSANLVDMAPESVANAGGGQGHENMQPFLTVNFVIAIQGLFPSSN